MIAWATKFSLVALSVCAACFASIFVCADEPDSIHFHTNYNEALAEAKLTKKPIFLEFRCAP